MISSLVYRSLNGLSFYQYSLFQDQPALVHGIFSRQGGISQGVYAGLNLSFSVGDEAQRVVHNRELVQRTLGIEGLQSLRQVHGKEAVIIDSPSKGSFRPEARSGDILMTRIPGQGLMIKQADCQSILLYDPIHQAVANLHCGWRGNVTNVIGEAVERMKTVYGTLPADLIAGIGPSLGPCCAQFIHYEQEIPEPYWKYQIRPYFFDLWQLSRDQLTAAGVLENRIAIAGICTVCRGDLFFSYRKNKITGRFATVIALTGC
jgi:polyphenol oxidase